jgi:SAM-dependent methyltransferase
MTNLAIDINTMSPKQIREELFKLPRTQSQLKQLQDIPLFEYLFTLTGGKIETITRGKNKGNNKYVAPAGYTYDRANVYKILTGMTYEQIVSVDTLLGSDFYFREHDYEGIDSYLDVKTPTELYRRKLYRWYWSMLPFKTPKEKLDLINKSTLWTELYNELLDKAKQVHKEDGFFQIDDYNKYHFELQEQIDTERDLQLHLK